VSSGLSPVGPPYTPEEVEQRRVLENNEIVNTAAEALHEREEGGGIALGYETFDKNGWPKDNEMSRQLLKVATSDPNGKLPKYLDIDGARKLQRIIEKVRERREAGITSGMDTRIISLWRPAPRSHPAHAVDIDTYAGQRVQNSWSFESALGNGQLYEDMLGGDTMPPVDTKLTIGLPRPPHAGAEAAEEYRSEQKRRAYNIGNGSPDGALHSQGDLVLKDQYTSPSLFFPRNTQQYSMPTGTVAGAINKLVDPWVRKRFSDLYAKDGGRVLTYIMGDAWDHTHTQKPK
jgi:hypothetical protein